jgi:hypothetical protein
MSDTSEDALDQCRRTCQPTVINDQHRHPVAKDLLKTKTNLWAELPLELQQQILDHSDALTQYLNDHNGYWRLFAESAEYSSLQNDADSSSQRQPLATSTTDTPTAAAILKESALELRRKRIGMDIWKVVFQIDWEGSLKSLPCKYLPVNDFHQCLQYVHSKAMLAKLKADVLAVFSHKASVHGYNDMYTCSEDLDYTINTILKDIAMRNCWHDVLSDLERTKYHDDGDAERNDVRLKYDCILKVHLAFFLHLSNTETSTTNDTNYNITIKENDWKDIFYSACLHGYLDVVRHLHTTRSDCCISRLSNPEHPPRQTAIEAASQNGHMDIVEYLFENCKETQTSPDMWKWALYKSAIAGHLPIFRYIHHKLQKNFTSFSTSPNGITEFCIPGTMEKAAENGHLSIVEYMNSHNLDSNWNHRALRSAAESGHLEIVAYLHESWGCVKEKCDAGVLDSAASLGRLEVVKYLCGDVLESGYGADIGGDAMERSELRTSGLDGGGGGHGEHQRRLSRRRCQSGNVERAKNYAAMNRHFDVVEYLSALQL